MVIITLDFGILFFGFIGNSVGLIKPIKLSLKIADITWCMGVTILNVICIFHDNS